MNGETQDRELEPRAGRGRLGSAGMDEMPIQGEKRKEQSAGQEGRGVRKEGTHVAEDPCLGLRS